MISDNRLVNVEWRSEDHTLILAPREEAYGSLDSRLNVPTLEIAMRSQAVGVPAMEYQNQNSLLNRSTALVVVFSRCDLILVDDP